MGWTSVHAADVYVAFDAQGVAHFADRALDANYRLLFKDLQADIGTQAAPVASGKHVAAPAEVRTLLKRAAEEHGLDYALLHAVAQIESGFNAGAVSPKGAVGLMQLMPDTAKRYGVQGEDAAALKANLHRMPVNVDAGSRYLRYLLRLFDGRTELALAAYNAGEGAVQRAGNRIPNYPETQGYVRKVMQAAARLRQHEGGDGPATRAEPIPPLVAGPAVRAEKRGSASVQVFRGDTSEVLHFERGFTGSVR